MSSAKDDPTQLRYPDFPEIWERQRWFNERFFADRKLDLRALSAAEVSTWTKEFVLHIENELHELLRETSWKMHRRSDSSATVRSNVLEEWVDAFKFMMGLAQVWGFGCQEIVEEFSRKSYVVEYRWQMERRLAAISPRTPIVAVDLDGVLNSYPCDFLAWAAVKDDVEPESALSIAALRREVGPKRYSELKDAYRESGEKRNQEVRAGAKELLDGLRSNGFAIVLISKRPYWRFSRIYADTLQWLEENELRVDAVLFHPEKHRKILEDFPGVVAVVEDDPAVAREILSIGKSVILVRGELNDGAVVEGATTVEGPEDALRFIEVPDSLRRWR